MTWLPREYQSLVVEKAINHLRKSYQQPEQIPAFVYLSVGWGKTGLYAFLAKHINKRGGKTLVLARQTKLVSQNSEFAWKAGVPNVVVASEINKGKDPELQYNTVFATEGTVVNRLDTLFKDHQFEFIAIDEVHMFDWEDFLNGGEKSYSKILRHFIALNPKVQIFGGTGSPVRGSQSILGPYWKECLHTCDTNELIDWGWLVKPVFGDPEMFYDYSSLDGELVEYGNADYKEADMDLVSMADATLTHNIMGKLVRGTADRDAVVVFCTSKKHCIEAKVGLLMSGVLEGDIGIITGDTPYAEQDDILSRANAGKCKYVINVGVLTTGVNVPRWSALAILRPIQSLSLFIQIVGRVLRIAPDDADYTKKDALIFDFAGCMDRLGALYSNPILEEAELDRASRKGETMLCPVCDAVNSIYARRCVNHDYWWIFNECGECGAKNDKSARHCSVCDCQLIDPNANLLHKAYTENDLIPVTKMTTNFERNTLTISYHLVNGDIATEMFWPLSDKRHCQNMIKAMVMVQMSGWHDRNMLMRAKTAQQVQSALKALKTPKAITHRINGKGKSVINLKEF